MTHVGSRVLHVPFRTWVVYPTDVAPAPTRFGPFSLDVSVDAPALGSALPLALVSHGSGSSPFLFRDLACALARAGWVVALVEHPGNNREDNTLADTDESLVARPAHLVRAREAVLDAFGPQIAGDRVAVIGQSVGACTALALAGGVPWSRAGQPLATAKDPQVAALVLLTPAAFWFVPDGALRDVTQPILVFTGEADTMTPPWHGHLVYWSVPDRHRVVHRQLPHVGHLSVLSPLPPTAPWRDPPGFDRATVHADMEREIIAFLEAALGRSR